ncbi:hypothetical protein HYO65_gp276 [Tenacibaculum phage PTm1]|uniref:Uncharacterized protein n=2 Tax=Shirahamavirus PTm1 TaxID=2846435 RepID=A0A5S9HXP8_9CAUD|nr:hypothetical protein HYO65_gp276 [Tenacibaculum phage PTm1]BBI90668.1 hypothetical protein [Tenacibaculum phage PTm1]BBI90973.1 hypothetical protein [Tenacibaculum phage PTm5]
MKGIIQTCKVELKINDNNWAILVTPIENKDALRKNYTEPNERLFLVQLILLMEL